MFCKIQVKEALAVHWPPTKFAREVSDSGRGRCTSSCRRFALSVTQGNVSSIPVVTGASVFATVTETNCTPDPKEASKFARLAGLVV